MSSTSRQSDWSLQPALQVALVLLAMLVVYVLLASATSLFDRDEPRFARAAVEMLGSGNYLVPHLNGELRPDKPVLIYWLMNVPLRILGPGSLAVRLPSIIGMMVAAFGTYLIGQRMFCHRVGIWAMIMLATSPLAAFMGTFATADGVLLGCVVVSVLGFVLMLKDRMRWPYVLLMLAGMALGQLTKGPVALLPVTGVVLGMRVLLGQRLRLGRRFWWSFAGCLLASVLAFLAWFIPASLADPELGRQMFWRHFVARIGEPQEGHGGGNVLMYLLLTPMYLGVILGTFFPWTIHLPAGISALIRGHLGTRRDRAFLWAWLIPTLAVMSLVATKLPHYVLPMYPAMALLCAAVIDARARGCLSEKDRDWLRGGIWFFGPTAAVVAAGFTGVMVWFVGAQAWTLAPAVVIIAAVGVIGVTLQLKEHIFRGSRWIAVGVAAFVLALLPGLTRVVEPQLHTSPAIAAAVRAKLARHPDASVSWSDYNEPTLAYYVNLPADQRIAWTGYGAGEIVDWAKQPQPGVLITYAEHLAAARELDPALPVEVVEEVRTLNYAKEGEQRRVVVVWRKGEKKSTDESDQIR